MATKIKQGDSIARDWTCSQVATFDTDWVGSWAIVATIGGLPIATGTMTKNTALTTLMVRVLPAQTNTLNPGDYFLVQQIENAEIGFRKEVAQERITIETQGISP